MRRELLLLLGPLALLGAAPPPAPVSLIEPGVAWEAAPADGVEMHVAASKAPGATPALRIDYDFHGRGGWAAARRRVDLELPPYYEIRFLVRGEGPANNLEVKLVDPSGENVWWHVKRDFSWPTGWTPIRIKKRQIAFAWGPQGGGEPGRIGAVELTVSASSGGRGTLWVSGLEIVATEPAATAPGALRASATSEEPGHQAAAAVDGDEGTGWRPAAGAAAELVVDLERPVELGGLTLAWEPGRVPTRFGVDLSVDGSEWVPGREVTRGGAPRTHLRLPEAEARFVRLRLPGDAGCPQGCGFAELVVRPLASGTSPDDFFLALASEEPRGTYPRGFGEAVYWTVVGVAGDPQEALVSEDGAVEVGERGFSLEPVVLLGGRLYDWSSVAATQSLADGDLPIPTVTWMIPEPFGLARAGGARGAGLAVTVAAPRARPFDGNLRALHSGPPGSLARLEVTAVAAGASGSAELLVRYRLHNDSPAPLHGRLFVQARPFQVNPPHQFLNLAGGVSPIHEVACDGATLRVGATAVRLQPPPVVCGAAAFDEGLLQGWLRHGAAPPAAAVEDPNGFASAAVGWDVELLPGRSMQVTVAADLPRAGPAASPRDETRRSSGFGAAERVAREGWRAALDRVGLELPAEAMPLVKSLRANLAFIEIHRDGPALQPGSRAYARSWIRDGALTGVALLRLRHEEAAAGFARWFAGFQYPDGKVPCCVDRRGADPVPEHDSHGELIHLIAEVYRYTGDRAFAEELFPHVERAAGAIEALRQQRRTAAYRAADKLSFFGLLPESISHEGYSAKPVHSYWDDTFAYRGLDDAVTLAGALGREELATTWATRRDELRADLLASIARVRELHRLDDLPASADLADFDSTSTTTMLDPGGLLPFLPRDALLATFERFWGEIVARRDGGKDWQAYTPYEIRHVGAFVRLGVATGDRQWRDRAHELLAWYGRDQRPPGWNGWPEAVHRDYRAPRFLGDLPHGWVGSDFIRSVLDLFAYEREASNGEDQALVLGAGIPRAWLEGKEGVGIRDLATPWGPIGFTLARLGGLGIGPTVPGSPGDDSAPPPGGYRFTVTDTLRELPPGGIVLVSPSPAAGQQARVDGKPMALAPDGTVVVRQLPAVVDFVLPAGAADPPHGR